jgi:hypothetical protein
MPVIGEVPGRTAAVQVACDFVIVVTGLHTTFLAPRGRPSGSKIHAAGPADCSHRAYGDFRKAIKVFLTCDFVGEFTRIAPNPDRLASVQYKDGSATDAPPPP